MSACSVATQPTLRTQGLGQGFHPPTAFPAHSIPLPVLGEPTARPLLHRVKPTSYEPSLFRASCFHAYFTSGLTWLKRSSPVLSYCWICHGRLASRVPPLLQDASFPRFNYYSQFSIYYILFIIFPSSRISAQGHFARDRISYSRGLWKSQADMDRSTRLASC